MLIEKYKSKTCRIDIEEGWKDIIENFLFSFQILNDIHCELVQIKQKFGECRIYIHKPKCWSDPTLYEFEQYNKVMDLAKRTEKKCNETCELCGCKTKDVIRRKPRFWVFKCCEKCYELKCDELKVENREEGRDVEKYFKLPEELWAKTSEKTQNRPYNKDHEHGCSMKESLNAIDEAWKIKKEKDNSENE